MKEDIEKELTENISLADIPDTYRPVASMTGIETFLSLCKYAGGDELYFPMVKTIYRNARNRIIRERFNGYNQKDLARQYDITIQQVFHIVKGSFPGISTSDDKNIKE
ncbi:hypothetical protein BEI59_17350 [Eisenbergiella tayi]|uniref:Mor transcription activator domain-containing protein n=1 Tax=Eisenbergiella tayi TaxID=1432052 RepID=A0A1E3UG40_9FIRM|nr:Mor transcription activator family protein [Eisenbergiella tayi]ODR49702.1 hypothetical protein BEI59_17350 [Eisenbergiella tayi]